MPNIIFYVPKHETEILDWIAEKTRTRQRSKSIVESIRVIIQKEKKEKSEVSLDDIKVMIELLSDQVANVQMVSINTDGKKNEPADIIRNLDDLGI